jgi:hypothetical protein
MRPLNAVLVTANAAPDSLILYGLKTEATLPSETSVLRYTRRHIPVHGILHDFSLLISHILFFYIFMVSQVLIDILTEVTI